MERLHSVLFGNEFAQSLIGVPPSSLQFNLRPFRPAFPLEIVQHILYLTALHSKQDGHNPQYALLEISRSTRSHLFPIFYETLEIIGMERMVAFANVFAPKASASDSTSVIAKPHHLISSSVKRLALIDKSPGDIQSPGLILPPDLLTTILTLCSSVQTLFLNYIRPIPKIDSFRPTELTIRRGLRYINLSVHPFKHVEKLHCRYEQLIPSLLFSPVDSTLRSSRLTHLCFTHHLDFPDSTCVDIVERCLGPLKKSSSERPLDQDLTATDSSTLHPLPNLSVLIVEIAIQKWDSHTDPSLRSALAIIPDPGNHLFVRVSPYNTALPVDGIIGPRGLVASGGTGTSGRSFERDVWDVTDCVDWRTQVWDEEYIEERIASW